MIVKTTTILALLGGVCLGPDCQRDPLVDVQCHHGACDASWNGSTDRSEVYQAKLLELLPAGEPSDQWVCAGPLEIDFCVEVDSHGRTACFWEQDGWAAIVAPACVVQDLPDWRLVGFGMAAYVGQG